MANPIFELEGFLPAGVTLTKRILLEGGKQIVTQIKIDRDDIVAFFAGIIAIMFGVAMIASWVPINKLTVSIVTLAALAPSVFRFIRIKVQLSAHLSDLASIIAAIAAWQSAGKAPPAKKDTSAERQDQTSSTN
jgi:hypothetical protein